MRRKTTWEIGKKYTYIPSTSYQRVSYPKISSIRTIMYTDIKQKKKKKKKKHTRVSLQYIFQPRNPKTYDNDMKRCFFKHWRSRTLWKHLLYSCTRGRSSVRVRLSRIVICKQRVHGDRRGKRATTFYILYRCSKSMEQMPYFLNTLCTCLYTLFAS